MFTDAMEESIAPRKAAALSCSWSSEKDARFGLRVLPPGIGLVELRKMPTFVERSFLLFAVAMSPSRAPTVQFPAGVRMKMCEKGHSSGELRLKVSVRQLCLGPKRCNFQLHPMYRFLMLFASV